MKKVSSLKKAVLKGIADVAFSTAKKDANTTCPTYSYQPRLPESVKNLRKF